MIFQLSTVLVLSQINILMFMSTVVGEIVNSTNQMIKNNTMQDNSDEHIFQLRTPINYTLEDRLMSLSLLVMLIIFLIIWYLLPRLFMYLAYHKTAEKLRQIEDSEMMFLSFNCTNSFINPNDDNCDKNQLC